MSPTQSLKMVLHCDEYGRVLRAETRAGAWRAAAHHEGSLPLLVDRASAAKCERFLQRVQRAGAAFGWELHAQVASETVTLMFAGLRQPDERLLVAVAGSHEELLATLDDAVSDEWSAAPNTPFAVAPPSPLDELTRVNSDLVSLHRELAKRNAELTALTKQRNQLLATAAHDLRNPILVVQGYCDLIGMRDNPLGKPQSELVEQLERAAALMLHVIEDTLEYASLEAGKRSPHLDQVDLLELVQRSVQSYAPVAQRKDIELGVSRGEHVPRLLLDSSNIERVIGNLLSNAIKFSQRGSKVEVALTQRDGHALLAVIDEGPGIAEAEVPLLFRPFQTTSARPTAGESSTGLGLAIVRELVEANGGEISVRSSLHKGSTFEARFPIPPPKSAQLVRPKSKKSRAPDINVRPGRDREPH